MSDFDKEAEREKLREKYERDQEQREVAEKMSELLLQGATMTNAHCSDCGDPIFRYDGQEFCATCEKAVDRGTGDADEESEEKPENIEVTDPDDEARVAFGGDAAQAADEAQQDEATQSQQDTETQSQPTADQAAPAEETPTEAGGPAHGQPHPPARQRTPEDHTHQPSAGQSAGPSDQPRQVPASDPSAASDVTAARESLVRTLTRFSQQAEAAEDPQRAQEYLAAAREAAETLSSLRR
ncbi:MULTISPECIES: Sjogren's syndrome/scleroderma autoantigen 1 family protein [Salinibaculum]|uniref:Sjogren's syndrome/scleroderma autoantigen 1 family protein n=1 Tax=Salinibaculum TaxID=2732368 RepID=UPI0030D1CD04